MKGILSLIEWRLAQLLDYLVRRLDPTPERPNGHFVSTLRADDPFWEIDGNTRYLHLGEGFGLMFERKDDE